MVNKIELPKDPELAVRVLDAEHASRVVEIGRIGSFFGSRNNAVVYLAALVIILATIGAIIIAACEPTLRADAMKALAALALSALGYMFGSGSRGE
jgi:hypothetical protein